MNSDRRTFLKTTGIVAGTALVGVGARIDSRLLRPRYVGSRGSSRDEILGWIREKAVPLASVEAGSGFADLEHLRRIIGAARIVSLGEATHGTREFFQLKHRLLEFCVSELGFTLFGIEASYPESLRVNDYVLHGTGNPAEALAGMRFWTWDTEEVLALIEWMRAWNRTHERKVKFYGFDMQSPTEAALGVIDYLKRVAPELAAASEAPLWPLSDDFSASRFRLLASETRESALAWIQRILEAFARRRTAWIEATSALEWGLARLQAVVLEQGARLDLAGLHDSFALRDMAMAQNVRSLLELEGPDARAVLWAHNGHVARVTPYFAADRTPVANMGSHLHEMFGRQHLVVGFAFNQGSFQAIEGGRGLVDHTVPPAPEGSLDHMLAAAAIPRFLLELATAPAEGPVADWLSSRPLSRSIGAGYSAESAQAFLQPIDPRSAYDVLAFVATTTAARANPAGRRPPQPTHEPARTRDKPGACRLRARPRGLDRLGKLASAWAHGCLVGRAVAGRRARCAHRPVVCAVAVGRGLARAEILRRVLARQTPPLQLGRAGRSGGARDRCSALRRNPAESCRRSEVDYAQFDRPRWPAGAAAELGPVLARDRRPRRSSINRLGLRLHRQRRRLVRGHRARSRTLGSTALSSAAAPAPGRRGSSRRRDRPRPWRPAVRRRTGRGAASGTRACGRGRRRGGG